MGKREATPEEIGDLRKSVLHDLRELRATDLDRALPYADGEPDAGEVEIDEGRLKDASNRLRRLLTDEKTLQRYRKAIGLRGEPHMSYYPVFAGPSTVFAQSAGATKGGAQVMGLTIHNEALSAEQIRLSFEKQRTIMNGGVTAPMSKWLSSPCMLVRGTRVTRSDVIRYMANKLGGVHLDHRRNEQKDRAYLALDAAKTLGSLGLDSRYVEFLSITQQLLASPGVAELT